MSIKAKILWTFFGMAMLVAIVGLSAVSRQRKAAMIGATHGAEDVARVAGLLLTEEVNRFSPAAAQKIVDRLSKLQGRDVVLIDTQGIVLADAVHDEVGLPFEDDANGEVAASLHDRQVRTFLGTSKDFPQGIEQIVVPLEDDSGAVIGAVIMEYTPLYRKMMQLTHRTMIEVIGTALGSLFIALFLAFYLSARIFRPLGKLTNAAKAFAAGQTDLPMPSIRDNEIGALARAFSDMVQKRRQAEDALRGMRDQLEIRVVERTAELEKIHGQLLETSRHAGMAEVATGVLHNVGNVLNSVNVSTTLVSEGIKKSKVANLSRVVTLLEAHAGDLGSFVGTPQGRQLPAFLRQLHEHLVFEQKFLTTELELLLENIEHIKEIVTMQQEYARVVGVTEVLNATDLVEDSLRMNAAALVRHGVTVERDYRTAISIATEKHKVLQILVNLIRNAKYACDQRGRTDKRLLMRVVEQDGQIKISVCDNGVGIPAENLTRIFSHGFSTKKEGHGFGLHSSALAAKELGGTLHAYSDGVGHGATFVLTLPATVFEPDASRGGSAEREGAKNAGSDCVLA